MVRDPVRGPGFGWVVVPVAATVGSAGWFVLNLSVGGAFDLSFALQMLRPAIVLGWYATLVVTPVAFALARLPRITLTVPVTWAAAAALTVVAGSLALDQREHLIAPEHLDSSALAQPLVPTTGDEAASYVADVVPELTQEYAAVDRAALAVLSDPTLSPTDKANTIEQEVVPAVAALITRWQGYTAQTDVVTRTHAVALTALRTSALKYRTVVSALRTSDQAGLAQAAQLGSTESQLWAEWRQWQATLDGG